MSISNIDSPVTIVSVPAPLHPKEHDRLTSLRSLKVLDKPADARFDRLTKLASAVFDVPVALITLVDENRQWFLSRCGLDVAETDRNISFCAHTLHEEVMLVIEDTLADPRFAANPLVVNAPFVRFYAGVVIRDTVGLPLGTLCIVSGEPRTFDNESKQILIQLAALAEIELLPEKAPMQQRVRAQLDAQVDPLTRAYSPERFNIGVKQQFAEDDHQLTAVAMVVLPGLEQLNDIFGRMVGDELLVELAQRLTAIGRQFDKYALGRLSGRRFALCVSGNTRQGPTHPFNQSLIHSLNQPFITSGGELSPNIHTGIAFRNSETCSIENILERCRSALATASSTRGAQVVVYDESYLLPLHRRLRIAAELQSAIDNNGLHLVFQPKVRCSDRAIDGFECLLRWQHHELGTISPLDILDAASDVNKLVALDRWVIDQAIQQRAAWQSAQLTPGTLSANITGETLLSEGFVSWLTERLNHYGVTASQMELEVLESSLFDDFDRAVSVLDEIRHLGVSISLDDFGTGYSSLAYLHRLPISVLKIDRAFVSRLESDPVHRSLCTGILSIAQNLTLSVVAEGVENESQFDILKASACDRVQGYFFSRPVSQEDATKLLLTSDCTWTKAA